jgi:hypothetical protein
MKLQLDYRLILVAIGGLVFYFLFWDQLLASNLLIYSLFVMGVTFTDKAIPFHTSRLFTAIAHLGVAAYLVYNNSTLAVVTWFITLLVYLGTTHYGSIKTVGSAMLLGFVQAISGPYGIATKLKQTKLGKINLRPVVKPIKYVIVPLFLLIVFCFLYSAASPVFAKYFTATADYVNAFFKNVINFLFVDISLAKCLFILLGALLAAGLMIGIRSKYLADLELGQSEQLFRTRRNSKVASFGQEFRQLLMGRYTKRKMALKTENIVGVISFAGLNLLLLCLNGIDVATLWLSGSSPTVKNYSAELHDGTNVLIFSIAIAMLLIVYFFSGNINFYRNNKWIKFLAYAWIVQNLFLVFSVFHRDYDYIFYHGLTYKRIGVAVFASLSLLGIVSVYIKVAKKKTVFYLYKTNAKIWYVLLLLLSFVNWDVLIVSYNLKHADKIGLDVNHLMGFSDKTLPILEKYRAKLSKQAVLDAKLTFDRDYQQVRKTDTAVVQHTTVSTDSIKTIQPSKAEQQKLALKNAKASFDHRLDSSIKQFEAAQQKTSWQSFSYVNWKAAQLLRKRQ